ncbi:uncharacterized protein LOC143239491 [Tachypleus tridentatus]|uniref:uncharacterized protein LOC143239491 n=1 Tax=Tachypleus tridentatus TaxID=6853 RepID=UPI003FD3D187
MSVEDVEDSELRDLVIQTLEKNGILGKIKAQLRASVFLALENEENFKDRIPLRNKKLQDFLETEEGQLAAALVRDFLDFFNLEFTLAVFDPEVSALKQLPLKNDLYHKLRVAHKDEPLLATVLKSLRISGNNEPDEKEDEKSHCQSSDSQSQKSEKMSVKEREDENQHQSFFTGSEKNLDDPFFDDPIPSEDKEEIIFRVTAKLDKFSDSDKKHLPPLTTPAESELMSLTGKNLKTILTVPETSNVFESPDNKTLQKALPEESHTESLSSLRNLPSLKESGGMKQTYQGFDSINKKMEDLVLDAHGVEDDYDDNFQSSVRVMAKLDKFSDSDRKRVPPLSTPAESELMSLTGKNLKTIPTVPETRNVFEIQDNKTLRKALPEESHTGSLSSLRNLPSLKESGGMKETYHGFDGMNKKMQDLVLDAHGVEDDYDDDFQSSVSGSEVGGKLHDQADKNQGDNTELSIEEEIEEDFSAAADDLLNSSLSLADELTTDNTISQLSYTGNCDYMENVI